MAVSLAFGEVVSTVIVLLVVPASYLLLEDARARWDAWLEARTEQGRGALADQRDGGSGGAGWAAAEPATER